MSEKKKTQPLLDDDEKEHVRDLFYRDIVPKLVRHHARNGVVGCDFAGPRFSSWQIRFKSKGKDIEIVDFEYDETGGGIDLDL